MRVLVSWHERFRRFAPGIGVGLSWVGGVFLLLAAGFAAHSWSLARRQLHATATVTENVSEFAMGGGVVYRPKLRFQAADGALTQVVVTSGSDEIEFAAGETVPVLYWTGKLQDAVIATVGRVYFWAILLGVLGVVTLDAGLILRWMSARQRR